MAKRGRRTPELMRRGRSGPLELVRRKRRNPEEGGERKEEPKNRRGEEGGTLKLVRRGRRYLEVVEGRKEEVKIRKNLPRWRLKVTCCFFPSPSYIHPPAIKKTQQVPRYVALRCINVQHT
jgi:hypothetical protein